ncbi:hypothetical protein L596_010689 [Steinernema carpocapsae]|uniref:Uncharacterized protein n=1 Tax=Steinernema carpocapsae TaxID=34508 RepID=A0A4U5PJP7_STECR|nr:hypothetical protein L596_010689 [Steinernema carpocapsae]
MERREAQLRLCATTTTTTTALPLLRETRSVYPPQRGGKNAAAHALTHHQKMTTADSAKRHCATQKNRVLTNNNHRNLWSPHAPSQLVAERQNLVRGPNSQTTSISQTLQRQARGLVGDDRIGLERLVYFKEKKPCAGSLRGAVNTDVSWALTSLFVFTVALG